MQLLVFAVELCFNSGYTMLYSNCTFPGSCTATVATDAMAHLEPGCFDLWDLINRKFCLDAFYYGSSMVTTTVIMFELNQLPRLTIKPETPNGPEFLFKCHGPELWHGSVQEDNNILSALIVHSFSQTWTFGPLIPFGFCVDRQRAHFWEMEFQDMFATNVQGRRGSRQPKWIQMVGPHKQYCGSPRCESGCKVPIQFENDDICESWTGSFSV